MEKGGFIRVLEATIAVLIIIGALLLIATQKEIRTRNDLSEILQPLLNEISQNSTLREKIITEPAEDAESEIEAFLSTRITNAALDFDVEVCELEDPCFLDAPVGDSVDIFVEERIITTTVTSNLDFEPKKVKIFLWRKT